MIEGNEHDDKLVDILYECQNPRCGHTQTIRYWKDETPLPATCCVKCRAGFGQEFSYGAMAAHGIGMLPTTGADELARMVA